MIIVSIMGGLGNQMFQYAAAKRLSALNGVELKLDASGFRKRTLNKEHTFQLGWFDIAAPQATGTEIARFTKSRRRHNQFLNLIQGILKDPSERADCGRFYEEAGGSQFKPEFLELKDDVYLRGYFNSYKYFHPIEKVVMAEYVPTSPLGPKAIAIEKLIKDTESVGIHFRRGDYVTDPEIKKGIDGIITDDYYRNAIDYISNILGKPHFFVFSNDVGWIKDNFQIPFEVTYVDINSPQRGHEDLWLMSRCRHHITAGGSTFSWWAAYLNPNKDKIVLRTHDVNNDPKYNHPDDFFPPGWITIDS